MLFLLLLIVSSCDINENYRIVKQWSGKTVVVSDRMKTLVSKDSLNLSILTNHRPKILVCSDSLHCGPCQLKLQSWDSIVCKYNSSIDFIFTIHPRNRAEILAYSKTINFNYPIFLDEYDDMGIVNNLPDDINYRCFLLNEDNQVLLIGNPMYNKRLMKLYIQALDD